MPVLLDTHILLWWRTQPDRLHKRHARLLAEFEERNQPMAISAITLWELAKMVEKGRIEVALPLEQWLDEIERHPLLAIVPLSARVASESVRLGEDFHKDPADQIIVATARCLGLPLMTADKRIHAWGKVALV